jgi:hypothetical protein
MLLINVLVQRVLMMMVRMRIVRPAPNIALNVIAMDANNAQEILETLMKIVPV